MDVAPDSIDRSRTARTTRGEALRLTTCDIRASEESKSALRARLRTGPRTCRTGALAALASRRNSRGVASATRVRVASDRSWLGSRGSTTKVNIRGSDLASTPRRKRADTTRRARGWERSSACLPMMSVGAEAPRQRTCRSGRIGVGRCAEVRRPVKRESGCLWSVRLDGDGLSWLCDVRGCSSPTVV